MVPVTFMLCGDNDIYTDTATALKTATHMLTIKARHIVTNMDEVFTLAVLQPSVRQASEHPFMS